MNLTNNFTLAEFNFRNLPLDDTLLHNVQMLADNAQVIREFIAKPLIITSWYRPITTNSKASGSKTSQHLYGEAMDFIVLGSDAIGLDELFNDIINGNIKLPHSCSQIIRETKGEANWIHIGIKTYRWLEAQKQTIKSTSTSSAQKSRATKRLTHCEFLRTKDTINFELIKYKPYGDF